MDADLGEGPGRRVEARARPGVLDQPDESLDPGPQADGLVRCRRTADERQQAPVTGDQGDVGLGVPAVDREDRGRHSVSSNGMPTVGSSSWSTVTNDAPAAERRAVASVTAPAVGSGHEWSSTTAPSPRTTVSLMTISASRSTDLPGSQSSPATSQPTWR